MKVELKPQAIKDLRGLQKQEAARIATKLAELENELSGNVKRLNNFTPEYRLRGGN
jgi:mRNA interferase RelE/StbE